MKQVVRGAIDAQRANCCNGRAGGRIQQNNAMAREGVKKRVVVLGGTHHNIGGGV